MKVDIYCQEMYSHDRIFCCVTRVTGTHALDSAISPTILFNSKRIKPGLAGDLPHDLVCRKTEKDSMKSRCFVD